MKNAITDEAWSLSADEFLWRGDGLTEAHAYLLPVLERWLAHATPLRVLDLGCGNGALTHALGGLGHKMVGLERSDSGLDVARRAYPDVAFVDGTIDEPLDPELRGQFDVVLAMEVIEHLWLPRGLFARAKEALLPEGRLIISTPYHGYWKNLALALAGAFDRHWHPLRDFGHVKFFSEGSLRQLCFEQGFEWERYARVGRIPCLAKSMIAEGRLRA